MQTKDYYKILELPPSATLQEIKSAYRRLAHQYHPDKNGSDLYASAQFEIIKEAYEILSHPAKKEYYLQQRWYDQVMNKKQTAAFVTPVAVLKQFLELDKYVSKLDVHRMDKQGLYDYISYVLSDETIERLNSFNEKDITASIIDSVLKSSQSLEWSYAKSLSERLMKLNTEGTVPEKIKLYRLHSKRSATWNKYKPWLLLLTVVLICYLIYVISS